MKNEMYTEKDCSASFRKKITFLLGREQRPGVRGLCFEKRAYVSQSSTELL